MWPRRLIRQRRRAWPSARPHQCRACNGSSSSRAHQRSWSSTLWLGGGGASSSSAAHMSRTPSSACTRRAEYITSRATAPVPLSSKVVGCSRDVGGVCAHASLRSRRCSVTVAGLCDVAPCVATRCPAVTQRRVALRCSVARCVARLPRVVDVSRCACRITLQRVARPWCDVAARCIEWLLAAPTVPSTAQVPQVLSAG